MAINPVLTSASSSAVVAVAVAESTSGPVPTPPPSGPFPVRTSIYNVNKKRRPPTSPWIEFFKQTCMCIFMRVGVCVGDLLTDWCVEIAEIGHSSEVTSSDDSFLPLVGLVFLDLFQFTCQASPQSFSETDEAAGVEDWLGILKPYFCDPYWYFIFFTGLKIIIGGSNTFTELQNQTCLHKNCLFFTKINTTFILICNQLKNM